QIKDGDVAAVNDKSQAPDILSASPVVTVPNATVTYAGASASIDTLIGSDRDYLTTTDRPVDVGRAITASDVTNHSRVIVLGRTAVSNLFSPGADVVGATIQINGESFQVVGVQAMKGTNGNQDLDNFGLVPYTAAQDVLTGRTQGYQQIVVEASSA